MGLLSPYKIAIVQSKLTPEEVARLDALAERHGAKTSTDIDQADIIITAIGARQRLQRHLNVDEAISFHPIGRHYGEGRDDSPDDETDHSAGYLSDTERGKQIVMPQWLSDSVTKQTVLPFEQYYALKSRTHGQSDGSSIESIQLSLDNGIPQSRSEGLQSEGPSTPSSGGLDPVSKEPFAPTTFNLEPHSQTSLGKSPKPRNFGVRTTSDNSRFACQRLSPLVCPNQELLQEIGIIKWSRHLDGNSRSALSYSRAISALKAYPRVIKSGQQVKHLLGVGDKIEAMINEFLNTGGIAEARGIATDPRFQALSQFSSIYTIGPTTARYYYDDLGVTTIEDLEAYAESLPDDQPAAINLRAALGYREDFAKGIPRAEVEEIARVVDEHLQAIAPGAKWTICGGYRRGKSVSNDVDIIATHHNIATFKGLCQRLTERLRKAGLVTDVFHHSSFSSEHPGARNRHFGSKKKLNFDSLDKALTAFRLPARRVTTNAKDEPSDPDTLVQAEHQDPPPHQASPDTSRPPPRPIKIESDEVMKSEEVSDDVHDVPLETFDETSTYRRVDLVFAPPVTYWTAVVGWTGSTQFERDLRLWANQMGLHFDSTGICHLTDTSPIFAQSEQDVFDILSLQYVPPEFRNADI